MYLFVYSFSLLSQVCREFQRGTCSRPASECRYAHPAEHIVVDATDNHVTVCMDFVKSKCTRDQCKYFHPPSHLQALVRAAHARNQAAVSYNNTNSCSTLVGCRRECAAQGSFYVPISFPGGWGACYMFHSPILDDLLILPNHS